MFELFKLSMLCENITVKNITCKYMLQKDNYNTQVPKKPLLLVLRNSANLNTTLEKHNKLNTWQYLMGLTVEALQNREKRMIMGMMQTNTTKCMWIRNYQSRSRCLTCFSKVAKANKTEQQRTTYEKYDQIMQHVHHHQENVKIWKRNTWKQKTQRSARQYQPKSRWLTCCSKTAK